MTRASRIRRWLLAAVAPGICALSWSAAASAEEAALRFDGVWDTILTCPNSNGALGFSYRFASIVTRGVLHAEKGTRGEPGWLQIDGTVLEDGTATLYADGLVGAAPFAVGQRPAGTSYGYHIKARFSDASGTGTRVEGRPCSVTFAKTK